jgi:VIT1/CCC1 family predicted Fe2+/Mn2+ transporter
VPTIPHVEKHFTGSESVRDVVIGMADGLTVPFALAAGLSAAVTSTHIIVTAGLAEIAAGAIAMGLGGYLAARTDKNIMRPRSVRNIRRSKSFAEWNLRKLRASFGGMEWKAKRSSKRRTLSPPTRNDGSIS